VEAESTVNEALVTATVRYQLDRLEVDGGVYGPAEVRLGLGNLPPEALLRIQQSVEEINAQQLPDEQKGMALLSVLMGNAPALLKGDPLVTIDKLSIQTPDGLVAGKLSLQSIGLEWKEIGNAPAVLGKLVADASLQMPKRLFTLLLRQKVEADLLRQFEQVRLINPDTKLPSAAELAEMSTALTEQQVNQWLGQEILVEQGDIIATRVTLADGLLSVNGKTIPLPSTPQ
jgi:uncharacterized protein YdgA (DUF945 family)